MLVPVIRPATHLPLPLGVNKGGGTQGTCSWFPPLAQAQLASWLEGGCGGARWEAPSLAPSGQERGPGETRSATGKQQVSAVQRGMTTITIITKTVLISMHPYPPREGPSS